MVWLVLFLEYLYFLLIAPKSRKTICFMPTFHKFGEYMGAHTLFVA